MDLEAFLARVLLVIVMITNPQVNVVQYQSSSSSIFTVQGGGKSPYDPGQTFRGLGEEETARQHAKTQTTQEGDFEGRTALHTHTHYYQIVRLGTSSVHGKDLAKNQDKLINPLFCLISGSYPFTFRRVICRGVGIV